MAVDFIQLMRDYMRLHGLNQMELAAALGVSRSGVTRWFQGARPKYEALVRVSERTGLPLDDLLASAGYTVVSDADAPDALPAWLELAVRPLTLPERIVLAETARGLLRLRSESSQADGGQSQ